MSAWPWEIVETLAIFGMMIGGLLALLTIYGTFLWLKDQIIFWCKRYKDKRFTEKSPKPRCYCIQCEYWHASESTRDTGLCCIWEKWTSADEMCARGHLRSKQGYKDEEWRIKDCKS